MRTDTAQAGFTLLEVVVALVIASLALSALFAGAATGLRSSHISGDTMVAQSLAQSHLAALGTGAGLAPGTQSGDDGDGFHWLLSVAQIASVPFAGRAAPAAGAAPSRRMVLLAVAVVVSWSKDGGTRRMELDTQRIAFAAPAPP